MWWPVTKVKRDLRTFKAFRSSDGFLVKHMDVPSGSLKQSSPFRVGLVSMNFRSEKIRDLTLMWYQLTWENLFGAGISRVVRRE